MNYQFIIKSEIIEWRGPAPFTFVRLDEEQSLAIKAQAHMFTYGWGVLYMTGKIGSTTFTTTLIPKDGRYLIPTKVSVKNSEKIELGDTVTVRFKLGKE